MGVARIEHFSHVVSSERAMIDLPLTRRRWLACLAALPVVRPVRAVKPWPLLLAHDAPRTIDPAEYLVSEKYDGVRAFWDGQVLRFRSGAPIVAPSWFVRRLPGMPLDGELWLARGRFDALSGLVRRALPDDAGWRELRYMVFELPDAEGSFARRAARLRHIAQDAAWSQLVAVEQFEVPDRRMLRERLAAVVAGGGEGLMLHRTDAPYVSGRSRALLKLKPVQDADAVVVGSIAGHGKHAGRMGALRVRSPQGLIFDIGSGFSDAERSQPPVPGTRVTYRYRGLTPAGVPRFASFMRVAAP